MQYSVSVSAYSLRQHPTNSESKQQEQAKSGKKSDFNKRKENDADILREKQKLADERKAAEAAAKLKK
ncbi:hypothetical protein C6P40_003794 [Pichia californica]|uniref:Small EDRK-rich factor-like N-terminal domain-containing protein n=1 Tax=Pichia californica TaxID=460514 RepID=A0A9P6WI96_9ASCO|nr:hypothetical protein C6P40_003794 [[Candida] californica]